jgi:GAF domain-containing protein
MELAAAQGFDIRVVSLPAGTDPADDPTTFESRLAQAKSYLRHRVEAEWVRDSDRQRYFKRVEEILNAAPDSPDRNEAWRFANDKLGLTVPIRAARVRPSERSESVKVLEAEQRRERRALAGVVVHPDATRDLLSLIPPEHFDVELHRRVRGHLLEPTGHADRELVTILAELDALAVDEAIDEPTAKELLLRLRERGIRRELARSEDLQRTKELQAALAKIREAVSALT